MLTADIKKCLNCNRNDANFHPSYGYTHCDECNSRNVPLGKQPEFYTQSKKDRIQPQRDKYHQDTEPMYIGDKPNPNFVKLYPQDAKEAFTEEELKRL